MAGFIGTSNLISATVRSLDGGTAVLDCAADETLLVPDVSRAAVGIGMQVDITVRPEKIAIGTGPPPPGWCAIRGRVREVVYLGTATQYAVDALDGAQLIVFRQNASDADDIAGRDQDVWLSWRPEHSFALQAEPGEAAATPDLLSQVAS